MKTLRPSAPLGPRLSDAAGARRQGGDSRFFARGSRAATPV